MILKNRISNAWMYWRVILLFFSVANVSAVFQTFSNFKHLNQSTEIEPIEEVLNSTPILVNGVLYKTTKKYYCSLWNDEDSIHTIVFGQKGWTFKRQDVNLTLAYPSEEVYCLGDMVSDTVCVEKCLKTFICCLAPSKVEKLEDYVITGFRVLLFTDGTKSKAYISSGGLLQDSISFSFICSSITTVSYQFWLYGTQRSALPSSEPVELCV